MISSLARLICVSALILGSVLVGLGSDSPNIIIITTDDQGYGDLGVYGHPSLRTPHLDRMAGEGMRMTNFYAAASVCTPSRAGLLTGRLPIRSGMSGSKANRVLYPNAASGLPLGELTLAEALKELGYATAMVGKWHLGDAQAFLPREHGFDRYWGIPYSNDMNLQDGRPRHASSLDEDAQPEWWDVPLIIDESEVERPVNQRTLTKRMTDEALRTIEENAKEAFFLYIAHPMPHVPLFVSEDFIGRSERGRYGDVIAEIDWSVGKILELLRKLDIADRTLVVFSSDNGPWLRKASAGGSAGPLRDGKGGAWEGGYRVPGIFWWPGRIEAGIVCGEIASQLDLFPTAIHLAGGKLPVGLVIDGVNMAPILFGTGKSLRDEIHYYRGDELFAIRKGQYKLHFQTWDGYSAAAPERHDPPLLVHLGSDPGEKWNVADAHPIIVETLSKLAEEHLLQVSRGKPQF
jgi:arylsulfatase A